MTKSTATVTASPFTREAVPARKGGAGRKPSALTLAFLAEAATATKDNAVRWTPNVKGLSTKAHNLRRANPSLVIEVRGDSIYGYAK